MRINSSARAKRRKVIVILPTGIFNIMILPYGYFVVRFTFRPLEDTGGINS